MNKYELKDIPYFLLVLLSFFPLMPYGIISVITILFALSTVLFYGKNVLEKLKSNRIRYFFLSIAFFLVLILTISYSSNKESALNEIRKNLNFLIFPLTLLLFFPKLSRKKFENTIKAFVASCLVLSVYLLIVICIYTYYNLHIRSLFDFPFRDIISGKTYLDLHPTYVCLWFAFSIFFLIKDIKNHNKKVIKTLYILSIIIFYAFVILLAARTVFIAINLNFLLLLFLLKNKGGIIKKIKYLVIYSIIIIVAFITIKRFGIIEYRFFDEVRISNLKEPKGRKPTSLSLRYGIYNCDYQIFKNNLLTGVGVGDVQGKLNECYKNYRTSAFKKRKLDSHNYFFYLSLSGGIFCLLLFLYMYGKNVFISIKTQDYLYFSFLVLIFICCLTENVLNRVHGNLFFSLFNSVFILNYLSNNHRNIKL
ncbi:O-antigen ligase family protein [Aquimarina amphilecti]